MIGQPQAYGSAPLGQAMKRGLRKRMNIVAILINVFVPWALFVTIFAVMSFSLHYQHPLLVDFVCFIGVIIVLIAILLAYSAWRKKRMGFDKEPTWYMFAAAALTAALLLAILCGDMNFFFNMKPFYDLENLNTYTGANPTKDKGQQLMDAGKVYFTEGSKLDMSKAMGFRNLDFYCVVPIVAGAANLTTYDFWAVGVNCCSGATSDFHCGDFNNIHARAGIRLMKDEQRPFFRLAVQQAEAAYQIKAEHPLFFTWMQDPIAQANAYRDEGFKYYLLGIFTHLAFSIFCVVCAVVGFSKMALM